MATKRKPGHVLARHGAERSAPKRPASLRVFQPVEGVPPSREVCVNGPRPCPHVRCRHHLWLVLGEDRPGRFPAPTTLRAGWLEDPMPPSCALDVAAQLAASGTRPRASDLAAMVGLRRSRVLVILAEAIAKLAALRRAQELGRLNSGEDDDDEGTLG